MDVLGSIPPPAGAVLWGRSRCRSTASFILPQRRRYSLLFRFGQFSRYLITFELQPARSSQGQKTKTAGRTVSLSTASVAVPEALRYIFGAIATTGDRRKEAAWSWQRQTLLT
jgi:hypothetical protein